MASRRHININNQWLPYLQDGEEEVVEEDLAMSAILEGIRGVLEREEEIEAESDSGPGWNNRGLSPHLKRLQTYLKLRYPLRGEEVAVFLDLTTRLLLRDRLPVRQQIKLLSSITTVLRAVKACCIRVHGFSMDARPLFKLMLDKTLGDDEAFTTYTHAGHLEGGLRSQLPQVVYHLRHYFTLESVTDLLGGYMADLETTTHYKSFQAACCIVLLLPSRLPGEMYDQLLPRWMEAWRRLDYCPEWDLLWLHLFCRARKHAASFKWEEVMPIFFTYLLSVFSLPLGQGAAPELRAFPPRLRCLFQPTPIPHNRLLLLSKLVVFFLSRGGDTTVDVVLRPHLPNAAAGEEASQPVPCSVGARHVILLLSSIRTYFNPSNSGRHSEELAVFLGFISSALARRVGWERADADYAVPPTPQRPPLADRDVDALVGAMLPLAHMSLYSKSMSAAKHAEQTIKHLACLRPQLVASMTLPVLALALDPSASLTMTHQAPSAMLALATLVRPLLMPRPYLLDHLPILLEWSLPGLDSNDPYKTAATVQFYLSILDWLPLRSDVPRVAYEAGGEAFRSLTPDDHEAAAMWDRAADVAPALADWSLAVLDRYLSMLQAKEKPKSSSEGSAKQAVGHLEAGLSSLGRILCKQLVGQMDAELHGRAVKRVLDFIRQHTLPGACKDVAYVLEACCRGARAEAGLKVFAPYLLDFHPASASARTLEWRLRLLAGALRLSGPAATPYCDRVVALVKQVEDHEDKSVRKAGGKLLRRTIQTLIEIFPGPSTSHPQHKEGGPFVLSPPSQDTLDVRWYLPGSTELSSAVHVFEALVEPAFTAIAQLPQGELNATQKRDLEHRWRKSLKTILNGIRAIHPLLVDLDGPRSDDAVLRIGTSLLLANGDGRLSSFVRDARRRLSVALHALLGAITHEASPLHRDVKAIKTWVKAASQLLTCRGSYMARRAKVTSSYMLYSKAMARNWVVEAYRRTSRAHEADGLGLRSGPGSYAAPDLPRSLLVSRVYTQHLLRCEEAAYMVPRRMHDAAVAEEEHYGQLVADLLGLSAYDISTVRHVAQEAVGRAAQHHPWLLKTHLPSLIHCLTLGAEDDTPTRIHERSTAATFLLRQRASMRMVASNWPLSLQLIQALATSSRMVASLPMDKQETLSERLSRVTLAYLEAWSAHDLTSDKRKREYQAAVDALLSMIQPVTSSSSSTDSATRPLLHWRYRLLIQWLLTHLSRPDAERPWPIWASLLDGLRSGDGQPLQKLSLAGLARLLSQELAPPGPNALAEASPDEKEYVVLADPVKEMEDDDVGTLVSPSLADALTEPAMLRTLCLALAHNHKEDGAQWSTGVEDLIRDAWRRRGANVPDTRLSLASAKFQGVHAHLVRLLLRGLGPRLLVPLTEAAESILEGMPTESELAYYSTVGEVLAGVMSEYTRTEVGEGRRARMWAAVLPIMAKVVPRLSLEYSLEWADALRFAAMHRTPEALEPITTVLVSKVISSFGGLPPASPPVASLAVGDDYTAQAKWLRLLQPLLIEFLGEPETRERGQALAGQVLPVLLSNLGHPYKVCRADIARTLFIIFSYGRTPLVGPHTGGVHAVDHARAVALVEGDAEVKGLVASAATQLSMEEEESAPVAGGGAADESTAATQELTRRKETVLQWVLLSAMNGNQADSLPFVLPLLPVLYECVRDKELELMALGKHAVRSLARHLWMKQRLALPPSTPGTAMTDDDDALAGGDALSGLLRTLLGLSKHRSWYVKLETAQPLALLQVQHAFLVGSDESRVITERLVELLSDDRKEVQDTARLALSAVLSAAEMGPVSRLAHTYCEMGLESVGTGKRRKDNKGRAQKLPPGSSDDAASASEAAEKQRAKAQLASTMVLSSLVLAYPYEVPPYVPRCMTVLARLFSGPPSLQAVIKQAFTDFKRTHQDEWESNHRLRFTPDELDALSDVLVSPHYYA